MVNREDKKMAIIVIIVLLVLVFGVAAYFAVLVDRNSADNNNVIQMKNSSRKTSEDIRITSPVFEGGSVMPALYTCDGSDTNPPLEISGIPLGAKSLVVVMDAPDAPAGTWDHWIKFDIPVTGSTFSIREGAEPAGVSGRGTSGNLKYHGPCPPSGVHHYIFRAYALDGILGLDEGSSKKQVLEAATPHVLAMGELVGLYSRGK